VNVELRDLRWAITTSMHKRQCARAHRVATRSNHEIETGEMGFTGQFALQKFPAARVGSGSNSEMVGRQTNVR
jgi:hypothetical protein